MTEAPTDPRQAEPSIEAHAIPRRYRSTGEWLRRGATRQTPAAIGALLSAWTGLTIALWIALIGIVVGALAGLVGGSGIGLANTLGISEGVGALAALLGAIVGAALGLALIYIYLILHPLQLAGAIASGVLVSGLVLFVAVRAEPLLMQLRGYRELSRREKVRLYPLLSEAARGLRLAVVPALWISDEQKPGAWAHMRDIVISRGLLGDYDASEGPPKPDLDDAALTAVLAHELHHWDAGDVVGNTFVSACFAPVVLIVDAINWVRQRNEFIGIMLWILCWPAWVVSKLVVVPLMMRRSRRYEFEADARAASIGDDYRLGLRRALDELSVWERPRTGWEDVLSATHPPIEIRMEHLEAGRQLAAPRLPEPVQRTQIVSEPVTQAVTEPATEQGRAQREKPEPAPAQTATTAQQPPARPTRSRAPIAPDGVALAARPPRDDLATQDSEVNGTIRQLFAGNADLTQHEIETVPYELNHAILEKLKAIREAMQKWGSAKVDVAPDDLDRIIADYDMVTSIQAETLAVPSTPKRPSPTSGSRRA